MKKILVLAAILMLVPVSAMAGMTAFMNMDELSSNDLSSVTGQTGITINAQITITGGFQSWGDNDGCTAFTTAGFVTLSTITTRGFAIDVSGLTIDACNDGTTSYVSISYPTITLNQYIAAVRIGDDAAFGNGASIGSLTVGSLTLGSSYIRISGH